MLSIDSFESSSFKHYYDNCCELLPENEKCNDYKCETGMYDKECCTHYLKPLNILKFKKFAE